MHIGRLGGHFDEEYRPSEYRRRAAKASFSVIRQPSRRKTASVSATSRNLRPRTRSEPCSATAARSASRGSAAQRGASSVASIRSIGGFLGRTSTLSSEVGDEDDISISFQSLLLKMKATVLEPLGAAARTCRRPAWPDQRESGDR